MSDKFVGSGSALALYDDVLFSWDGDTPAPPNTTIDGGLNYNFGFEESSSGPMPTINGFNTRSANYRVFIGNPSFTRPSGGGSVNVDVNPSSNVSTGVGNRTLFTTVPLNSPISITLNVSTSSSATASRANQPASTTMTAVLRITRLLESGPADAPAGARSFSALAAPLPPPVFVLPTGYTVNSVSMGVVDNIWVAGQVPEPGTWAMLLAGLGLLGLSGRQTRRPG